MTAMLDYVKNTKVCRSVFLLNYFGEKSIENCGTCDICTEKDNAPSNSLKDKVFDLLKTAPRTSRQLMQIVEGEEKIVLLVLQRMLEDELIILNHKNEYTIKT